MKLIAVCLFALLVRAAFGHDDGPPNHAHHGGSVVCGTECWQARVIALENERNRERYFNIQLVPLPNTATDAMPTDKLTYAMKVGARKWELLIDEGFAETPYATTVAVDDLPALSATDVDDLVVGYGEVDLGRNGATAYT